MIMVFTESGINITVVRLLKTHWSGHQHVEWGESET